MNWFGAGAPAGGAMLDQGVTYGPEYRPDLLLQTAGNADGPMLGPDYNPTLLFLDTYKWPLIAGGAALFLLAGGSILGIALKKKRKMGRYHRRRR